MTLQSQRSQTAFIYTMQLVNDSLQLKNLILLSKCTSIFSFWQYCSKVTASDQQWSWRKNLIFISTFYLYSTKSLQKLYHDTFHVEQVKSMLFIYRPNSSPWENQGKPPRASTREKLWNLEQIWTQWTAVCRDYWYKHDLMFSGTLS